MVPLKETVSLPLVMKVEFLVERKSSSVSWFFFKSEVESLPDSEELDVSEESETEEEILLSSQEDREIVIKMVKTIKLLVVFLFMFTVLILS